MYRYVGAVNGRRYYFKRATFHVVRCSYSQYALERRARDNVQDIQFNTNILCHKPKRNKESNKTKQKTGYHRRPYNETPYRPLTNKRNNRCRHVNVDEYFVMHRYDYVVHLDSAIMPMAY